MRCTGCPGGVFNGWIDLSRLHLSVNPHIKSVSILPHLSRLVSTSQLGVPDDEERGPSQISGISFFLLEPHPETRIFPRPAPY